MAKIGECCKKIDHENKKMVWQIKEAAMNNNNVKLNIPQQESVDDGVEKVPGKKCVYKRMPCSTHCTACSKTGTAGCGTGRFFPGKKIVKMITFPLLAVRNL